jgi:hypothetical protein
MRQGVDSAPQPKARPILRIACLDNRHGVEIAEAVWYHAAAQSYVDGANQAEEVD